MAGNTNVRGNRIVIEGRVYEARVLGGGRFNVINGRGTQVGMFAVKGRAVEAEDLGVEGADPVATIGQMWVAANLSPQAKPAEIPAPVAPAQARPQNDVPVIPPREPIAIAAPPPTPAPAPAAAVAEVPPPVAPESGVRAGATCRVLTHDRPDASALKKAIAYHAWLRAQDGVIAAYLSHDTATGKTVSVTIWETRDKLTALRYAKPPEDAAPLKAVTTDLLWVVG